MTAHFPLPSVGRVVSQGDAFGSIIWRNSAPLVRDIVAFDYRTMQDAAFRIHAVIGDGAVHRGPIVPHDEVARLPFVRIDELVLRTKVCQLIKSSRLSSIDLPTMCDV